VFSIQGVSVNNLSDASIFTFSMSSPRVLKNEAIFDHSNGWPRWRHDVDDLSNDGVYPLFVSMSCLTGYFAYPEAWTQMYNFNYFSLGEALLRAPGKGAAAAFMPTGMTSTC